MTDNEPDSGRGVYYGASVSVSSECAGEDVYVDRRRELGRSGRDVPVPRGQIGDHRWCARPSLEASMSLLPDPADRGRDQHHRPHLHRGAGAVGGRPPGEADPGRQPDRRNAGDVSLRADVHLHRRDTAHRAGSTGCVARDDLGFILTGPDLRNVCGWTLDRPPHHLETSVPGVFVAGDVRADSAKRVAAAVGEGSMAVMLVHRYLSES